MRGFGVSFKIAEIDSGRLDRCMEYLVVWVLSTSVVGLACALGGWFLPIQVFLLGVGLTLLYIWASQGSSTQTRMRLRVGPLLLLLLVALFFRLPGFDYVLGGQDEGLYVNMAEHIERSGGIAVQDEPLLHLEGGRFEQRYLSENRHVLSETNGKARGYYVAGIYIRTAKGSHLDFQFYHLFPVWMALVGGLLGPSMGIYALTLFALLSIWMAYRLVLELTGSEKAGWVAGLLLALNPLHAFFSKFPVTEIEALAFSLTGFTYLAMYWKAAPSTRRPIWLVLSVLGFAGYFFTRISGFMYVPFIVALAVLSAVLDQDVVRRRNIQYWALACVFMYACSVAYGLHWSHPYATDIYRAVGRMALNGHLLLGGTAVAVLLAGVWAASLAASRYQTLRSVGGSLVGMCRRLLAPVVYVGLLVGIYRIYQLGSTNHFQGRGLLHTHWGLINQVLGAAEATSLATLIVYLGPLLVPVYVLLVTKRKSDPPTEFVRFISAGFFVYTIVLIRIIPYGPYYARYLLSETVPLLLLFVVLCWHQQRRGVFRWILTATLGLSLGYMFLASSAQLGKRESDGLRAAVQRLVAPVGKGDVVLLDSLEPRLPYDDELKTTLLYTAGKPVITVSKKGLRDNAYLATLNGIYNDVYLITPSAGAPKGFEYDGSAQVTVWSYRHGHSIPHRLMRREDMRLYRFRLVRTMLPLNTPLSFSAHGSGARWLQSGWYTPEGWGVWSDGKRAEIGIDPKELPGHAHGVRLVFGFRTLVTRTHPVQKIIVSVNGEERQVREIQFPDHGGSISVDLSPGMLDGKNDVRVEFELPDAVKPKSIGFNADQRVLAIGLQTVSVEPLKVSDSDR